MTKTKIVCTIGPACNDEATLTKMIQAGMDVARLNFSHGEHEGHRETFNLIRQISDKLKTPVAILQDLCGPKIRLGELPGEGVPLNPGDLVRFTGEGVDYSTGRLHVSYTNLAKDMKPGEPLLIDDGLVRLEAVKIEGDDVICKVLVGGTITSHKGVNLPGSNLSISAITPKDEDDLKLGMEMGVDFVALSFVRSPGDITRLKKMMEDNKKYIPIIAKIEKQEAVNYLDDILNVADGAMVARGDLGVEVSFELLPLIQKQIIEKCNRMSKPVITATQMMDSMIRNPIPTRAEVTDIANAILDGTDAVMLSGETASGKYPLEAVATMNRIALATEPLVKRKIFPDEDSGKNMVDSISQSTCNIACQLNAKAIIVLTDSGRTARLVSRYRPPVPILAITYSDETVRRLNLSWGIFPLKASATCETDKMLENAANAALDSEIVKGGDLVVTTAGIPAMVKGSTNMIKVDVLGHVFLRGYGVGLKNKVTGRTCIIRNTCDAENLEPGDILVTKRLDDSFVPVVGRLAGVIAVEGGRGSYGEYFCEKFNIPGILGVPNAMEAFFPGQILTLEPDRGIIYGSK